MDDRKTTAFEGREYFDDRLYMLTICPARTHANSEGLISMTFLKEISTLLISTGLLKEGEGLSGQTGALSINYDSGF